ncbi:hypothetical protein [Oceaniradius stylonematis]|uniref:hypothetical protein n=1 Tax=Oceaniradius stylonematis TaxID=2184161 RepID=UPI00273EB86B|nr:hypothetical protein [Oceaniradius stylonematis]
MARSKVRGHRKAARNIRRVAKSFDRPIGEASRYGLQPMLRSAKQNLLDNGSYESGELYDGMRIRKIKKAPAGHVQHHVTATGKAVSKAHLVEFGTAPHWQPKRQQMHPGAKPHPFIEPAYHEKADETVDRFGKRVGPAIERQAARIGRGS